MVARDHKRGKRRGTKSERDENRGNEKREGQEVGGGEE